MTNLSVITVMTDIAENRIEVECSDWTTDVQYESYRLKLLDTLNTQFREPAGLPRMLPWGVMCIACGSRVTDAGTLPCDH
jgi:hypothetical protein